MLYKEKNEIIEWLDKYNIKNYTLVHDETYGYRVDVAGHVYLGNQNLTEIPLKFGKVIGNFHCGDNQLTSLEGSPQEVEKDFWCRYNQLTSLKGSPRYVGNNFVCDRNQLTSLQVIPESIGGKFYCRDNPELGELQDMRDFNVIKTYLLAEKLSNDLNTKDNKKKFKL